MIPLILLLMTVTRTSISHNLHPEQLLKSVYTNLTHTFAQAVSYKQSSGVSHGGIRGIKLGSAGSKVGNDIGAATSFGVSQIELMRIVQGVSASKAKTSEALGKVIHSQIGKGTKIKKTFSRSKRHSVTSTATSVSGEARPGTKSNLGSTGVHAGPVATSISIGSLLQQGRKSFSAVNGGATAAHAGKSDSTTTFSNSDLQGEGGSKGD